MPPLPGMYVRVLGGGERVRAVREAAVAREAVGRAARTTRVGRREGIHGIGTGQGAGAGQLVAAERGGRWVDAA